jgi:alpha-beta hydrolase superfamily lysophospholipase
VLILRILKWGVLAGVGAVLAAGIYLGEIMLRLPRKPLSLPAPGTAQTVEVDSADGLKLRAWFFPPPAQGRGSVILVHGQTDNRAGMLGFADFFASHGYGALAPDMRGHGESGGRLSTYGFLEAGDMRRWVDWLARKEPGQPVFGLGESMGGAILIEALATERRFCAIVAEAPYATLRDIAYDRLAQRYGSGAWQIGLRPVLELAMLYQRLVYGVDLGAVSPADAVTASRTPVLLIHGTQDDNTPARHSRIIYERNPGAVTPWEVPGAGHARAWGRQPKEFERRLLEWFDPAKRGNCADSGGN